MLTDIDGGPATQITESRVRIIELPRRNDARAEHQAVGNLPRVILLNVSTKRALATWLVGTNESVVG